MWAPFASSGCWTAPRANLVRSYCVAIASPLSGPVNLSVPTRQVVGQAAARLGCIAVYAELQKQLYYFKDELNVACNRCVSLRPWWPPSRTPASPTGAEQR